MRQVTEIVGRIPPKSEEPDQRVVIAEQTPAGSQSHLGHDVPARFAEQRIVAVDALLLRQPQRAREAVDRQQRVEIVDLIVLVNGVRLPLVERARDHAERLVGR